MMNIIDFNQNSNKPIADVTATNIHTPNQLIMPQPNAVINATDVPQPAQNNALPPPKYNNHGNKHGVKEATNIEHNNSMKVKTVSKQQESINRNTMTLLDEDMDISDEGNSDDDNTDNTNISNTQQITQYTSNNLTYNHTRQHLCQLHHMQQFQVTQTINQMTQMQYPIGYQIPYQIAYPMQSQIPLNQTVNQTVTVNQSNHDKNEIEYISRGQVNGYELSDDQSGIPVDRYRVLSCIIYVGFWNDTDVNIDRLRDEASTFGSVLKITTYPTQLPYKHAFVKFDSRVDAENARNGLRQRMKGMNDLKFVQKVGWARPPKKVIKESFQFDTGIGEIFTDM